MKVAFLTIEDISSGLFKSQVLDIIEAIIDNDSNIQFNILIINRPWLYFKHKKFLFEYRNIKRHNLKITYIPLLPPLRNSLKYFWISILVTKWLELLYKLFFPVSCDIIHSRSYWPTIAAINLSKPLLFDLRSLWVSENLSSGDLTFDSNSHKYWKEVEKECLERSTVSTCVSQGMIKYVKGISPLSNFKLIPISVNPNYFLFSKSKREEYRKLINWDNNNIYVYSGSFGQSGINIIALKFLFQTIEKLSNKNRLLIITSEQHDKAIQNLELMGLKSEFYTVRHPKFNEISWWLSASDFGIHALPLQLDSETRLGTKVVEYWMNGLPVVVNQHVGAAVDYINKFKFGYVLNDTVDNIIDVNLALQHLLEVKRKDISTFAKQEFSSELISLGYLNIYKSIIDKN
jgi:glycosyltransferase involved in cell wall biosynthesis